MFHAKITKIMLFLFIIFGVIILFDNPVTAQSNYTARTWIDSPKSEDISFEKMVVSGWKLSNDKDSKLKILIDDKEQKIENLTTRSRADVISTIPGYGGIELNPEPGYSATIDISGIKRGYHTLKTQIISAEGKILTEQSRKIYIESYKARTYIDSPKQNANIEGTKLVVQGWIMSDDLSRDVKIFLDDKEQQITQTTTRTRPDVISAVPGYGGINKNPEPGYSSTIDVSKIKSGKYKLKVQVISRNGEILTEQTRDIFIENYRARTYIDSPKQEAVIEGASLAVQGWYMSSEKTKNLRILIDGQEHEIIQTTTRPRPDVISAVPGYGGIETNPEPGYSATIDILKIKDGKHNLKVQILSSDNEVMAEDERQIIVQKYKAKTYIDYPKGNSQTKDTLTVSGWVMSTDANRKINIYLNGEKQIINNITTRPRPDVISAVPSYGGIDTNAQPGYSTTIDVSNKEDGKYTLKVQIVSSTGEVLTEDTRQIYIHINYEFGIDVSTHNGTIDWGKVKQSGVKFAIIRAGFRGYGKAGTLVQDAKFVENMKGAISNGIDVGIYFYSQAINTQEAIEEVEMILKLIRENGFSKSIALPIIIDTEESSGRADQISIDQRTKAVKAFCDRVEQAGYKSMIYSNKYWLSAKLNMNELSQYDFWLAHYTGTNDPINNPSDYKGSYQIWQYSSTGRVDGINGNVDLNIKYKKYSF